MNTVVLLKPSLKFLCIVACCVGQLTVTLLKNDVVKAMSNKH